MTEREEKVLALMLAAIGAAAGIVLLLVIQAMLH